LNKKVHIILTEEAYELLGKIQEMIKQKEMVQYCTQSQAITKVLVAYYEVDNG
jgi:hypothetical protein